MIILKFKFNNISFKIKGDSFNDIADKIGMIKELKQPEATQQAITQLLKDNNFNNIIWVF